MTKSAPGDPQARSSVKAPLIFSAVLAAVAGLATMIFATGGGARELRWDLGFTAAGIAFIVSLVFSAMLLMTEKPNEDYLGEGTGINRSSAKIPGGSGSVGRDGMPMKRPEPKKPEAAQPERPEPKNPEQ